MKRTSMAKTRCRRSYPVENYYLCAAMKRVVWILLAITMVAPVWAQRKSRIKLEQADIQRGGIRDGQRVDWVIGNVIFIQNQTTIYCDSAQFIKSNNSVDAYGHIRILDGDSITVTANRLKYNGNTRVANLRGNVVFVKKATATLYTDFLDYYRNRGEARYFNKGKLVDSANTLTSEKGYYQTRSDLASFKKDVVAINPDYTVTSDTLQYNTESKTFFFHDLTRIVDKEGKEAIYKSGFYNTVSKKTELNKGTMETPTYRMRGNQYNLDDVRKIYKSLGDVVMVSKEENLVIYGQESVYNKNTGLSRVYKQAYAARVADDGDTLFISADTLLSVESDDPAKKRLIAYNHVKIYKSDLQGSCDSLVYVNKDSMLYFYNKPVLWTTGNQLTADSIRVQLREKTIDRIYFISNAFAASRDTLNNFNQVKGRKMTTYFKNGTIGHVVIEGNGESIYYVLQEKEDTLKTDTAKYLVKITFLTGMNKMICSNMRINFKDGKINNVSSYVKPDASFYPPHELKPENEKLKGFEWREAEKPEKNDVVKRPHPPPNAKE
jgi:lipopolysaccharide export system protein LptA